MVGIGYCNSNTCVVVSSILFTLDLSFDTFYSCIWVRVPPVPFIQYIFAYKKNVSTYVRFGVRLSIFNDNNEGIRLPNSHLFHETNTTIVKKTFNQIGDIK